MKTFKPMLAGTCSDISKVCFSVLASPKLDGVRAVVIDGVLMSRSLKPIPNRFVQELFAGLPDGLDGELIVGDPTAPDAYRKTVSCVMSDDHTTDGLNFHVFDSCQSSIVLEPFKIRFNYVRAVVRLSKKKCVKIVEHSVVVNQAELEALEHTCLTAGYEGVMLRSFDGPYKFGRSSEKEGYLLKVKRFCDSEAVVLDTIELQHNENEAKTNALGRTERSTCKAGKVDAGVLGALSVRDTITGVCFEIGTGFTADDRELLWKSRKNLVGKLVKYKYFPTGGRDKPRFPVWLGWRDTKDL